MAHQPTNLVPLPNHIIKYLQETGFSDTEIAILKHMLHGGDYSLRELSAHLSKSTGVLDQACKKLMNKKIITRSLINEKPRFLLESPDSLLHWVRRDRKERWATAQRKDEDFDSFITSMRSAKSRPDVEYFEGMQGIMNAYRRLLSEGCEVLEVFPDLKTRISMENDLSHFFNDSIKYRRKKNISLRSIVSDGSFGKKYQSRDYFEYRCTLLVSDHAVISRPEKWIAGDLIGCIDLQSRRACIIYYPELAHVERCNFEALWGILVDRKQADGDLSDPRDLTEQESVSSGKPNLFFRMYVNILMGLPVPLRELIKIFSFLPRSNFVTKGMIPVEVEILSRDGSAIVHEITKPFALRRKNINKINLFAIPPNNLLTRLFFFVASNEEASYLIDELGRVSTVHSVTRLK